MNQTTQTISQALGGLSRVSAMIGVKYGFIESENRLSFQFKAKAKNKINCIVINYDRVMDLWNVEFKRIWNIDVKDIETIKGIYSEDLKRIIEDVTGLRLSL